MASYGVSAAGGGARFQALVLLLLPVLPSFSAFSSSPIAGNMFDDLYSAYLSLPLLAVPSGRGIEHLPVRLY